MLGGGVRGSMFTAKPVPFLCGAHMPSAPRFLERMAPYKTIKAVPDTLNVPLVYSAEKHSCNRQLSGDCNHPPAVFKSSGAREEQGVGCQGGKPKW